MVPAILLFAAFSLLSGAGVFWIVAHHRGRMAGILGAAVTLLFFAALLVGLFALLRKGGFA
jgi:hypothetical protein